MKEVADESYISLLQKINSKPIIMERIFSYTISRPNILLILISKDKELVKKLNEIFSKVSKYNSDLDKEFIDNLNKYSKLREMNNNLIEIYQNIKNNINNTYNALKNTYKFSYISYTLEQAKKYFFYNLQIIDETMIKGLIFDYLSTLDSITLTFLPQRSLYLDGDYILDLTKQNMNSKEENKINQKIKLLLLFDENYFFNNIYYKIKLPNIEELEIIFDKEFKELYFKQNHLLHIYLNNYLSKIDTLDRIKKINFHNLEYEEDLYQTVLGYLFDGYYFEKDENIRQQFILMPNLKTVNIEMTFLYIYEKIKLYFYIYELFPSLNAFSSNKKMISEVSFSYYLCNKILIINNSNTTLKSKLFYNFIDFMLNNENIEFIFVINHNKIIFDNEEKNEKEQEDKKINLSKLREFTFINEQNDDIKNIRNKFIFNKGDNTHEYKGYDKDNNLIYYRMGETQIKSFDLIDLFKNNKIIERIEFINEEIVVKFNPERTNLEILYNGQSNKDKILNNIYFMPISNFSKFIKIQNNLINLTINRFDFSFHDIVNDNLQILTINYEKNISTLEYKNNDLEDKLNLFPNLTILNLGSEYKYIKFVQKENIPQSFKKANLILKYCKKGDFISKIKNKFKKYKKGLNIEIIENNISNNDNEEDFEENEYEGEEEDYNEEEDDKYYDAEDYL